MTLKYMTCPEQKSGYSGRQEEADNSRVVDENVYENSRIVDENVYENSPRGLGMLTIST